MKKKSGKAAQATYGNITGRMHIACWKSKATKNSQHVYYLSLFHSNYGQEKAPEIYVIFTLYVLFIFDSIISIYTFLRI